MKVRSHSAFLVLFKFSKSEGKKMGQLLNLLQGNFLLHGCPTNTLTYHQHKACFNVQKLMQFQKNCMCQSSLRGRSEVVDQVRSSFNLKAFVCNAVELEALPHIQTLSMFPKDQLVAKVVMVRFDSTIVLGEEVKPSSQSVSNALFTIKYLHEAGAKLILVSDWNEKKNLKLLAAESIADILSSVFQYKVVTVKCLSSHIPLKMEAFEHADILLLENLSEFKEEVANCSEFTELLSSGVDIFVNDCFSQCHKILASTVGVARICYANVAGFHFEDSLGQLKEAAKRNKKPYVAIIGGDNLYDKAAALQFLASKCDAMVFVGMMAFHIMHALGLSVPSSLGEHMACKAATDFIQFARDRNTSILYPKDFWCVNAVELEIFPSHGILDGWVPVDLGPRSLDDINSLITKCEKVIWIGPVKFKFSNQDTNGASELARMLSPSKWNCDITVVGNMACTAILKESGSISAVKMFKNASVVWEFLKGRMLPGVMALDRAYPFKIDWSVAYRHPAQPLVVDIGSGNGLFLLGMARKRKDLNYLGLEINGKLVRRCLHLVHQSGIKNGYFIATNATSTFRSIISSYPGELALVSIQCPNPDFNKSENRWRMLRRSLIEAVVDLLSDDGKVFLQSDIEAVALRMKEEFLKYCKGKLILAHDQYDAKINQRVWLRENPFGVRSDWERHVINRGAPMYRLMLSKSTSVD
ncbi:PGK domain-containing protein/Methyltransf_4 domain-containing protein [Cephalotus follicularis]|uniref:Phosphoglycerate kinase n=1 Tax=Cephalotus follicularis TaxID=3775 RepID=A0A1Q3DE33_CEPFO|nr:PGK domain-containing protein/Methyltransf_4 domain-containing protein [Cephalotus follicularis]